MKNVKVKPIVVGVFAKNERCVSYIHFRIGHSLFRKSICNCPHFSKVLLLTARVDWLIGWLVDCSRRGAARPSILRLKVAFSNGLIRGTYGFADL